MTNKWNNGDNFNFTKTQEMPLSDAVFYFGAQAEVIPAKRHFWKWICSFASSQIGSLHHEGLLLRRNAPLLRQQAHHLALSCSQSPYIFSASHVRRHYRLIPALGHSSHGNRPHPHRCCSSTWGLRHPQTLLPATLSYWTWHMNLPLSRPNTYQYTSYFSITSCSYSRLWRRQALRFAPLPTHELLQRTQ